MDSVSAEQFRDFMIVLMAFAAVIVLIGNVVKTLKDWHKPKDEFISWRQEVDRKLGNDDKRLKSIEDGNKVISRGILALLSHEINGNSDDKLRASQQEITNYLIDR